jgi:hypothetical protein
MDKAAALQVHARQRSDVETEKWVAEIRLRANVRIGELIKELQQTGGRPPHNSAHHRAELSKSEVLKAAGISHATAQRAETLANYKDELETYIAKKSDEGKAVKITEDISMLTIKGRRDKRAKQAQSPSVS